METLIKYGKKPFTYVKEKIRTHAELKEVKRIIVGKSRILIKEFEYHLIEKSPYGAFVQNLNLDNKEFFLGVFDGEDKISYQVEYNGKKSYKILTEPKSNLFSIKTITTDIYLEDFIRIGVQERPSYPDYELIFSLLPKEGIDNVYIRKGEIKLIHKISFPPLRMLNRLKNKSKGVENIVESLISVLTTRISKGTYDLNPKDIEHSLEMKLENQDIQVILKIKNLEGHINYLPTIVLNLPGIFKLKREMLNEFKSFDRLGVARIQEKLDKIIRGGLIENAVTTTV